MKPKSSQIPYPFNNCLTSIFNSGFKESLSNKEVLLTFRQVLNLDKNLVGGRFYSKSIIQKKNPTNNAHFVNNKTAPSNYTKYLKQNKYFTYVDF